MATSPHQLARRAILQQRQDTLLKVLTYPFLIQNKTRTSILNVRPSVYSTADDDRYAHLHCFGNRKRKVLLSRRQQKQLSRCVCPPLYRTAETARHQNVVL